MHASTSDKTFHLKWNNHLQNLSQLFATLYSSSVLADVTLSCRDGAIRAHKLVLSACSPYFEQIFRDNPCKHPVIILKGIPYAEINLLVEFMYKGSVDVQEIDLQSLMHTASELEIRGLAYELRKDASSLLNVNLNEYPSFATSQAQETSFSTDSGHHNTNFESNTSSNNVQSNLDRLHQIHLYQQSMCRSTPYSQVQNSSNLASEVKRKRKNEDPMPQNTTTAVKNILAAAAKELAEKKDVHVTTKSSAGIQTEDEIESNVEGYESDSGEHEATMDGEELPHGRDTRFKGKKRVSVVGMIDDPPMPRISNKKPIKKIIKITTKPPDPIPSYDSEDGISKVIISSVSGGVTTTATGGLIKCVNLNDLRSQDNNVTVIDDDDSSAVDTSDENNLLVERAYESAHVQDEDYDSNDSKAGLKSGEDRVFKCDLCGLSFVRKFHMKRHRRTHTGERPFQCDDCPFSFNRSSHLARHRRTHTGERPYHCEACGRTFTRGDKLKLHLRICEKDEYVLPTRLVSEDKQQQIKKENTQSVLPGMVSIGHSERHQLMFTPSGDVLLAPRSNQMDTSELNASSVSEHSESNQSRLNVSDLNTSNLNLSMLAAQPSTSESLLTNQFYGLDAAGFPIKRGRGRPRKKPLPVVVPLIKKKRGRPPKIIKIDPSDTTPNNTCRPIENYNASNLPYGDFSYLTDIISTHFNQSNPQAYQNLVNLESAKYANLIANTITQNMAASIVKNMTDPLKLQALVKDAVPPIKDPTQVSKDNPVNSVDDAKPTEAAKVENDVSTKSDDDEKQPVVEDEAADTINEVQVDTILNADSETSANVADSKSDDPVLPNIGECTVKAISKE